MADIYRLQTEAFPQLSYRKTGSGPAMVLLHGFPENGELWYKVWPGLSERFTLIIPDLPGVGGSSFKGDDLSIEDMAESVKLVLDKESIDKAVIVGHSMGGYTAFAFAELYEDRVAGLSLVHSLAFADTEEKKENRRKAISLIQKGGKEAFIKQMVPNLFSADFKKNHPDEVQERIDKGIKVEEKSLVAFYNAMINRPDRSRILTGAAFPIQWIVGEEDTVAPKDKVLQQAKLASVNFVEVYKDSAHMSMLEQPGQLIDDLAAFGTYCSATKKKD